MNYEGLEQFKNATRVNTVPRLKDLYRHITPQYATQWQVIGTLLGIPTATLDIIEHDSVFKASPCCNAMLRTWLQVDSTPSWHKLFAALESPALFGGLDKATLFTPKLNQLTITSDKGIEAINILSNRVGQINEQTRFMVDDDAWPPEQPKSFTPLLLIHYQGHRSSEQVIAMAKLMNKGDITSVGSHQSVTKQHSKLLEVLDTSTVTKELKEILAPLERGDKSCFILVEGPPGIGKSVLLKEIAYQWADKKVLQAFKVVLLICLRDPTLQDAKSIPDLLQCFCKGDPNATDIVTACSKYLFDNGGKDLVFLFDGFDELPVGLQKNSLIAEILKRHVLPYSGLVVSSRPHASGSLHKQSTLRVDILGFTEEERHHYLQQALQGQPCKVDELTKYLQHRLTISSLCFIPFNMVVLLYLYKQGVSLPATSTELYNYFICLTICRHFAKQGHQLQIDLTQLADLPEPYSKVVKQLAQLSLDALGNNKLVFTFDEIKAVCPDIVATPAAINGYGLLQAVQHAGQTRTKTTFNFLHFSMQEFLAAYHITLLPRHEELEVLEEKFWSSTHLNMFAIYLALTKGQRPSFKYFLSGGDKAFSIAHKFLDDQLKCVRLYRCFHEAGDIKICKIIEQSEKFSNKVIDLSHRPLTASDVECVTIFLTSSLHKKWVLLNLSTCYIQDHGLHILHRGLRDSDVTITDIGLNNNGLTTQSAHLICEIAIKCDTEVLGIYGNHTIGEDQQLYTMLTHPSCKLKELFLYRTGLSSAGANHLFTALRDNKTLQWLTISHNAITDDACDAITKVLEGNGCLAELYMYHNPISSETIQRILQSLQANNKLSVLGISKCCEDVTMINSSLQERVNKNRESRGYHLKFEIDYSRL